MSGEFVGKMYLERGSGGSPQTYTRVCEVFGISGLGENNDLVDVTTFCSGGTREYIGGLADGAEITIEANYVVSSAQRLGMIADVKDKVTRSYRVVVDDDGDGVIEETFWFNAAAISWQLNPSIDDKNTFSFTLKISGDIDITSP